MKFLVIGSGTWGSALTQVLTDNGYDVLIWGKDQSQVDDININHRNAHYFGNDIAFDPRIKATTDLKEAVKDRDAIIVSIPTLAYREVLQQLVPLLTRKTIFINTAKGFDTESDDRISELLRKNIPEELRYPIVSIIGPSHAEEVIVRDLTCVCAVSQDLDLAYKIAKCFSNNYFRVYPNNDEIGSEIGVAMKNAIAIASGILKGLNYGDNARAALCTRGLSEIVRFGEHYGGDRTTYLGLTGLGDLIVTCYSFHSRNFTAGLKIGQDDSVIPFFETNTKTVEGIRTIKVIHEIAISKGLELPIIEGLYKIVYENAKPSEIVAHIMDRPIKEEYER